MSRIRTFVALELSPDVVAHCRSVIKKLGKFETGIRWVDTKSMHLTLKFLGDVQDREIHEVCKAVAKACAGMDAFDFSCGGIGAFPGIDRPRTIWLGIREGSEALAKLSERIEDELHQIGYPKERRRFHPHITLGKLREGGILELALLEALESLADFDGGESDASEVTVFSSELLREGPLYNALSHAPLNETWRKKKAAAEAAEEDEEGDKPLAKGGNQVNWNSFNAVEEDEEDELEEEEDDDFDDDEDDDEEEFEEEEVDDEEDEDDEEEEDEEDDDE